jgi:hypothetical protein
MIRSTGMPGFLAAMLLLLSLGAVTAPATAAERETIVFMRHGEKPPEGLGQLDCQGLNRALALPWVLISRYGKAEFVFAPNPTQEVEDHGQHYNYVRPLATIEPTAIALGRPVDTRFGFRDTGALAHDLMAKRHHNALVFVAWEHVKLVEAVRTLVAQGGGDPAIVPEWPDSDFDSLYILTFTRDGDRISVAFSHQQEGLNGRSTSCP